MCQFFLQQLIGAVEKLEAAMDSWDVTCTVSITHERGAVCFEIQQAAVEKGRNEVER